MEVRVQVVVADGLDQTYDDTIRLQHEQLALNGRVCFLEQPLCLVARVVLDADENVRIDDLLCD